MLWLQFTQNLKWKYTDDNNLYRLLRGFLGGSESKESTYNARFDPWVGKILKEGNGSPLQYSSLENSIDRGAWWATVHELSKSQTRVSDQHTHRLLI